MDDKEGLSSFVVIDSGWELVDRPGQEQDCHCHPGENHRI